MTRTPVFDVASALFSVVVQVLNAFFQGGMCSGILQICFVLWAYSQATSFLSDKLAVVTTVGGAINNAVKVSGKAGKVLY